MTGPATYTHGLGELIRAHRLYMCLSKDDMAARLKMNPRTYDRIESGQRDCPPGLLVSNPPYGERGVMAREDPEARTVPVVLPAFTDSRTFRAAFPECVAYGFFPQKHMSLYESWPLVHNADERIHTNDLGLATRCYRHVARTLLG